MSTELRVSIPDRIVRWCVRSVWAPVVLAVAWTLGATLGHPATPMWQSWLVAFVCGFSFWSRARKRWGT